ncbi:hypothetical protein FS749_016754 [Ceratobasidium sp. UAMH 11750]|nr:hypothetical protein FS749_016754 [Ceratobasidium sp. UAMH 11750]
MHSELDDPGVDRSIATNDLATSRVKTQRPAKEPPYGLQDVAFSPHIDASAESLPLSDLSDSPSPPTGRRLSLLSDTSVNVPGPLTPTKRLFDDIVINDASNLPLGYKRIHPTPHPKPRLPAQLTPHPQARVVSLPEWSHNRNPFLESLRNPRSVSSPVRLRPAPLSPIYHEVEEEVESSFEVSEPSSGSLMPPPRFPVLVDNREPSRSYRLNSSYIHNEQLYAAPHGLFFTPPSSQSLVLSPPTTGPDRPLPMDRSVGVSREGALPTGQDSEDEVSSMLHHMSIEASSQPNRSSVAASTTSRVSSPESVVFLSSMAKIPRAFLGVRRTLGDSAPATSVTVHEPEVYSRASDNRDDEYTGYRPLSEQSGLAPEKPLPTCTTSGSDLDSPQNTRSAVKLTLNQDWILFDEPPKPIPALHGPASLPYARCPSGAEGVVLDNSQPADGLVWGLSDADGPQPAAPRATPLPKPQELRNPRAEHQHRSSDAGPAQFRNLNINSTVVPQSQDRPSCDKREMSSILSADLDHAPSVTHSDAKGKHVRFLDLQADNVATQTVAEEAATIGPQLRNSTMSVAGAPRPVTEDLALILQEQLERARKELRALERAKAPTRQETLDQLRRFGVPFRSHIASDPVATESQPPSARFQFVKKSGSLADLLATQSRLPDQEHLPIRYGTSTSRPPSRSIGSSTQRPGQSRVEPRSTNMGSDSLSNVKSIPLLKLRERQHAESQSRRVQSRLDEQTSSDHTRGPSGGDIPDLKQNLSEPRGLPLGPNRSTNTNEDPRPSAAVDQAGLPGPSNRSPNRRRPRKSGKRARPDSSTRSGSPQKENDRVPKELDAAPRQSASRQAGRKKGAQRSRSDSLPQNASPNSG